MPRSLGIFALFFPAERIRLSILNFCAANSLPPLCVLRFLKSYPRQWVRPSFLDGSHRVFTENVMFEDFSLESRDSIFRPLDRTLTDVTNPLMLVMLFITSMSSSFLPPSPSPDRSVVPRQKGLGVAFEAQQPAPVLLGPWEGAPWPSL